MIDIINIGVNYIIEMVAAWQYFRSFYSSKCSKQTECMFMVSAYVMMFCLFWLQIFWFNAVDFLIINCFLCFYLFSRRMSSSVFHALILTVAMVVTEVIIELVCISCFYAEFNFLCYCIYWQSYILLFGYTNYYCGFYSEGREFGSQKRFYSFIECHSIDVCLAYSCNCSNLYEWPYRFHNGWNAIGEYGASSCYEFCCILGL